MYGSSIEFFHIGFSSACKLVVSLEGVDIVVLPTQCGNEGAIQLLSTRLYDGPAARDEVRSLASLLSSRHMNMSDHLLL